MTKEIINNKPRRICLWAGPGAGKSTTAAQLFAILKKDGYSIELVTEYVKSWAYINRNVQKYDQVYLNARQMHDEYRYLSNGVKNIITDSPASLSCIYTKKFSPALANALMEVNKQYDNDIVPLNIYISRGDKVYKPEGRWQTYEQALEKDIEVLDFLKENYKDNFYTVKYGDIDSIYSLIKKNIEL